MPDSRFPTTSSIRTTVRQPNMESGSSQTTSPRPDSTPNRHDLSTRASRSQTTQGRITLSDAVASAHSTDGNTSDNQSTTADVKPSDIPLPPPVPSFIQDERKSATRLQDSIKLSQQTVKVLEHSLDAAKHAANTASLLTGQIPNKYIIAVEKAERRYIQECDRLGRLNALADRKNVSQIDRELDSLENQLTQTELATGTESEPAHEARMTHDQRTTVESRGQLPRGQDQISPSQSANNFVAADLESANEARRELSIEINDMINDVPPQQDRFIQDEIAVLASLSEMLGIPNRESDRYHNNVLLKVHAPEQRLSALKHWSHLIIQASTTKLEPPIHNKVANLVSEIADTRPENLEYLDDDEEVEPTWNARI